MSLVLASASSQYVSFGALFGSSSINGASLEALVKLQTVAGGGFIIHIAGGATTQQRLALREIAGPVFQMVARPLNSGASTTLAGTTTISTGVIYHLVAVTDFVGGSMKLYLNGALEASVTGLSGSGWGSASDAAASAGQAFGCRSDAGANFLNGTIQNLAFYNYAMSASDVAERYHGNAIATPATHYYTLSDGAPGSTATGAGTNVDTGTATAVNGTPNNNPVYNFSIAPVNWVYQLRPQPQPQTQPQPSLMLALPAIIAAQSTAWAPPSPLGPLAPPQTAPPAVARALPPLLIGAWTQPLSLPLTGSSPVPFAPVQPQPSLLSGAWTQPLPLPLTGPAPVPPALVGPQPSLLSGAWTQPLPLPLTGLSPTPIALVAPQPSLLNGSWVPSLQGPVSSPAAAQPKLPVVVVGLSPSWVQQAQLTFAGPPPAPLALDPSLPALISGRWVQQLSLPLVGQAPTPVGLVISLPTVIVVQSIAWAPQIPWPLTGPAPTPVTIALPLPTVITQQLTAWAPELRLPFTSPAPSPLALQAVIASQRSSWVQRLPQQFASSALSPLNVPAVVAMRSGAWVQVLKPASSQQQPSSVSVSVSVPLPALIPFTAYPWSPNAPSYPLYDLHTPVIVVPVFPDLIPPEPPTPPGPTPRRPIHTVIGTPGGGFPTHTILADQRRVHDPFADEDAAEAELHFKNSTAYKEFFERFSGLVDRVEQKIETKEAEVQQTQHGSRLWAMMALGLVCGKIGGMKGVFVGVALATVVTSRYEPPKQLPGKTPKKLK